MKKLFTIVSSLLFVGSIFAQNGKVLTSFPSSAAIEKPLLKEKDSGTTIKSRSSRAVGDIIYEDDFSDASTWVIQDEAPYGWAITAEPQGWYFSSVINFSHTLY